VSRYKKITAASFQKLVDEGRGQGYGKDYVPWLTVRDVPSQGLSTRTTGWKTERIHHFLSIMELSYFYVLEWATAVQDIREQYPLAIEQTLDIANRLGIKHPMVPGTNENSVMTTDFLIDVMLNGQPKLLARSIKPERELGSHRVIEKMMIEQTFWEERGIDFKVVTEREIPKSFVENVEYMYHAKRLEDSPGLTAKMIDKMEPILHEKVSGSSLPLVKSLLEIDHQIGLEPGTSLWIVKHLIANQYWRVDMSIKFDPSKPLEFIRERHQIESGRAVG
jgi:hypothetical protein